MDKVKFWSKNEQAKTMWDSLDSVQNAIKIEGNQLIEQIDFDAFLKDPLSQLDELYRTKSLHVDEWEKQVLNALQWNLLKYKQGSCNVEIPSLNNPDLLQVKNGQVVSFRCMIQNIMDSDFWPHEVMIKDETTGEVVRKSTLLRGITKNIIDVPEEAFVEKQSFIGITSPGENIWVANNSINGDTSLSAESKRIKLLDEDNNGSNEDIVKLPNFKDLMPKLFQNAGDAKPVVSAIKILRECNLEDVKPNDIVEITGLIYWNNDSESRETSDEVDDVHKLPDLHAFSCIKLAEGNSQFPLIKGKLFPLFNADTVNVSECVNMLREILSLTIGGDRYAAVYLMCAIVARVRSGNITELGPVGKLTLNLSGIPDKSDVPELYEYVLKKLMPRTLRFDVNVENMNSWKLTPVKTETLLDPGLLQIPGATHVMLNETNLQEGKLDETGVRNLGVLRELISEQRVKYDYTYQYPELPTQVPIVILSTSPSILPCDVRIVVKSDANLSLEERRKRIDQLLDQHGEQLRTYIGMASYMAQELNFSTDNGVVDDLEDFLRVRNQTEIFHSKMSANEFSAFVTTCRLWDVLHGHGTLSKEGLEFCKDVERIRDSRLAKK